MENTSIGDRHKAYEHITRYYLPKRAYTLIRIDGKAFHTYTRGLKKPFDKELMEDMNLTGIELCKEIQGVKFAYIQSDEISLLLTDFEELNTQAWFENNIQKMTSVSASIATARFNFQRTVRLGINNITKLAHFDSRVWQVPNKIEVENYFIWRQQDWTRNSIQAVAQTLYSPKQLHGKNTSDLQELIFQKGINWNNYSIEEKRGRFLYKEEFVINNTTRNKWTLLEVPIFTQNRDFLSDKIPNN